MLGRQRQDSPMLGGLMLDLEERMLVAQAESVVKMDPGDFGDPLPEYGQKPLMTMAAGKEAARSRPASPAPLIGTGALGTTPGINPAFTGGKGKAPAFPSSSIVRRGWKSRQCVYTPQQ